jgi:two-component system, NarL family, sensor histidine kinase UhpB
MRWLRRGSGPRRYVPLLHRVAAVNALLLLLVVGVTIVVLVPGHESSYRLDEEGIVLAVAVILVVLLNVYLLRRIVRPLQQLTELARTVDLADPRPPGPDAAPNSEAGELAVTLNQMLARLRIERREATGRVLAGQEAERLRIAQELHDQVGQELTAVLLLISRVEAQVPRQLQPAVSEAQDAVRASLEDVRRIAVELRPEALDDLGLDSALAVLCNRFAERSGAEISCRVDEPLPSLAPEIELVIYRVAQEALTNAARHSGGAPAELRVEANEAMIVLTVRDRGTGFDPDRPPGSGIRGMRERAGLIGATLDIHARPGEGVEVCLRVPLQSVG